MKKRYLNRKNFSDEVRGTLLVLLTALISGFSIVANKFFIVKIDSLLFTLLRAFLIGIIFFAISFYISKSRNIKFNRVSW